MDGRSTELTVGMAGVLSSQHFSESHRALSGVELVKNRPAMQETPVRVLGQQDPWRRDRLPTPVFLGFPGGSDSKESACNVGDLGSIPWLGRFPGGGHGNPL